MTIAPNQAMTAGVSPSSAMMDDTRDKRYLFGPVADFLCLGGISLFLFPVTLMLPEEDYSPLFLLIFLAVAQVVNNPHFAFSYQVFYEQYLSKAFGPENSTGLRARYIFAGIVVPVLLAGYLAYGLIAGSAQLLGYGANLMGFLVGWHYVKQGYGMLMVDAALKRQFFDAKEKNVLLINSYAMWMLTWLGLNSAMSERIHWGIKFFFFEVPQPILTAAVGLGIATSIMALFVLAGRWRANGGSLPLNGVVAYVVSLYMWQLLARWNVLWFLVVPALHSLQYIIVVARYRLNRFKDESGADTAPDSTMLGRFFKRQYQFQYAVFVGFGLVLGYIGFWAAPEIFQAAFPYDKTVLGATAFLFVFSIFINVHHYFLDNVMWRSQNADVRKYLFS